MVGEKMETESLDHISKGLGKEYLAKDMACELKGGGWARGQLLLSCDATRDAVCH